MSGTTRNPASFCRHRRFAGPDRRRFVDCAGLVRWARRPQWCRQDDAYASDHGTPARPLRRGHHSSMKTCA